MCEGVGWYLLDVNVHDLSSDNSKHVQNAKHFTKDSWIEMKCLHLWCTTISGNVNTGVNIPPCLTPCILACCFSSCHESGMESWLNPLISGRSGYNFNNSVFSLVLTVGTFRFSYGNALKWMLGDLLMINQLWFRWWLGAFRQHAIT